MPQPRLVHIVAIDLRAPVGIPFDEPETVAGSPGSEPSARSSKLLDPEFFLPGLGWEKKIFFLAKHHH